MRLAQVFQEPGLVLLRENVLGHLLVHARCPQLLEQLRRRHFQLAGELGNARLGHGPALLLRKPVFASLHDEALGALGRSEEHTSELQSRSDLVCRLLLEKKKKKEETAENKM